MTILGRVKEVQQAFEASAKNAANRETDGTTPRLEPVQTEACLAARLTPLSHYQRLVVPENQGRKYASVANDYNPIHLHALGGKLFGFPRAIAHGMWTAARVLSLLEPHLGAAATSYDVSFRQPVLLSSCSTLKHRESASGQLDFDLLSEKGSKVQVAGTLTCNPLCP